MNHPDLTTLSDAQIAAELVDNQKFITNTFDLLRQRNLQAVTLNDVFSA
jgi:hypothetical protein